MGRRAIRSLNVATRAEIDRKMVKIIKCGRRMRKLYGKQSVKNKSNGNQSCVEQNWRTKLENDVTRVQNGVDN